VRARGPLLALALAAGCGEQVAVYDGPSFPHDPPPPGPLAGRLVSSNGGDDTLSIIDPSGAAAPGRVVVGLSPVEIERPYRLAADPAGRFLYVNLSLTPPSPSTGPHGGHGASSFPGWVLKLETAHGREVARAAVDPNPSDAVLTRDGKLLYVTHYDLGRWGRGALLKDLRLGDSHLLALDTETMTLRTRVPVCPAAHAVRLSPDEATAYVACGPDELAIVELRASPPAVRRVPLAPDLAETAGCLHCPYTLALAPDGTVWVAGLGPASGRTGGGTLDVFDPTLPGGGAFDPRRALAREGSLVFVAFAPGAAGERLYLLEQREQAHSLRVYTPDGPDRPPRELAALALPAAQCQWPDSMVLDGGRGHLICLGDGVHPGTYAAVDLATPALLGAQPIGVFPDGLVLVPPAR
jgi:DNA-binding beta-propeller fold protein YncE